MMQCSVETLVRKGVCWS